MNWLDMIGWIGSALLVWSLLQNRILRLRALNLVGCLVLIGFNAALTVWPMVGLNVVLAVINIAARARMIATRHDERTYQVVEVGTGDGFLDHALRVHATDIKRFNPGFTWPSEGAGAGTTPSATESTRRVDAEATRRSAFLIMRADELVGVVLARDAGNGTAQIELDYVTPRFRDLTPGEFVYRRSPLFTDRGFRRVVTPPGMVAPYYDRLGFRRSGRSYALDLPAAGTA